MVGSAVAYGLARRGADVVLLDEGDIAYRAARGNFGLVWTQGKGDSMPAYAAWSLDSAALWPEFAERMTQAAERDIGYRRSGGLAFCLGEEEYTARDAQLRRWHNLLGAGQGAPPTTLLDRAALEKLLPETPLGPRVVGASLAHGD